MLVLESAVLEEVAHDLQKKFSRERQDGSAAVVIFSGSARSKKGRRR